MRKLRILIFEDDPALAALLKQVLLQKGHDVHVFSDPTSCPVYSDHEIESPQNTACAGVIISDHMMPNMTGVEYYRLQRLRGCKAPDENKALITGSAMHADLKQAINELGCHFIKKPFKVDEILRWVDECAERIDVTEFS
jgi:CheY-like chemotaxis protein